MDEDQLHEENGSELTSHQKCPNHFRQSLKIVLFILCGSGLVTAILLFVKQDRLMSAPSVMAPISTTRVMAPMPTTTPELAAGTIQISPKDGMAMVYVPSGAFMMGSPQGMGYDEEKPQHTVFLSGFWMDQTEVTNAMYADCVAEGVCSDPGAVESMTRSSYYDNAYFGLYPVVNVSWEQALAYCQWAGRRLPTEAEWEKAARGSEGSEYPWGNTFDCKKGNFDDETQISPHVVTGGPNCDGYADTSPVGSYLEGASPYGVLDMAGNVWEWVADWFDANYYSSQKMWIDPQGPVEGEYRVARSGSAFNQKSVFRTATRVFGSSTDWGSLLGFRCAMSQP